VERRREQGWFHDFTRDELVDMLERCGWTIEAERPISPGVLFSCKAD
jgi:hypothetical protein